MKVLITCEESQEVCKAFRRKGHQAFSNDIEDCSGGHPEWHLKGDCRNYIYDTWDLIIAHPPCDDLAVSGARWFKEKQADGRQQKSIEFFMLFTELSCEKVAIENPISIMSTLYRKPDQIIQPWQFGHGETKATCLWLKGLPLLQPTNVVSGRENRVHRMPPGPERKKLRSKTFPGIAAALATQYTAFINSGMTVSEWGDLFNGLDISRSNAIMDKYVLL